MPAGGWWLGHKRNLLSGRTSVHRSDDRRTNQQHVDTRPNLTATGVNLSTDLATAFPATAITSMREVDYDTTMRSRKTWHDHRA